MSADFAVTTMSPVYLRLRNDCGIAAMDDMVHSAPVVGYHRLIGNF
jgi:hypothetical protein